MKESRSSKSRTKWWKLKDPLVKLKLKEQVMNSMNTIVGRVEELWKISSRIIRETG